MAKAEGVPVPERLIQGGVRLLRLLRFPSGSFAYSYDHRFYPQGGIYSDGPGDAATPGKFQAARRS